MIMDDRSQTTQCTWTSWCQMLGIYRARTDTHTVGTTPSQIMCLDRDDALKYQLINIDIAMAVLVGKIVRGLCMR